MAVEDDEQNNFWDILTPTHSFARDFHLSVYARKFLLYSNWINKLPPMFGLEEEERDWSKAENQEPGD